MTRIRLAKENARGNVEPGAGVEPATYRLRIDCSATELPRRCEDCGGKAVPSIAPGG